MQPTASFASVRLRRPSRGNPTPALDNEFWRRTPGWARVIRTGLDADSLAILRHDFEAWRGSPRYEPALGRRFLEQMLGELLEAPALPDEPWNISASDRRNPIVVHCEASCWVADELRKLGLEPVMERWLYWFVTRTPMTLVSPESLRWAFDYAADHDLDPPWL